MGHGMGGRRAGFARLALAFVLLAVAGCATRVDPPASTAYASPAALAAGAAARIEAGTPGLQCVPYARDHSGIAIFGDAHEWWEKAAGRYPRAGQPTPGAVLVLNGYQRKDRGHVAVVRRILDARTVIVDHANWLNGGEINLGTPVLDVSPRNDWSSVRVWYVPARQFGRRIYAAAGFIYPAHDRVAAR